MEKKKRERKREREKEREERKKEREAALRRLFYCAKRNFFFKYGGGGGWVLRGVQRGGVGGCSRLDFGGGSAPPVCIRVGPWEPDQKPTRATHARKQHQGGSECGPIAR